MAKFTAPKKEEYNANIQAKAQQEQKQEAPRRKSYAQDAKFYRFSLKLPIICKTYLQETCWRTSCAEHRNVSINDYITKLVLTDMEQHPDILESLDELNIN